VKQFVADKQLPVAGLYREYWWQVVICEPARSGVNRGDEDSARMRLDSV